MKKIFKIGVSSLPVFLLFACLTSVDNKKVYQPGDYIEEDDAYFASYVDNEIDLVKAKKYAVPSDEKYSSQKTRSLGSNLIGDIESVWDSYTGKGTTVAIIDDGFDYCHDEYVRADGSSAILSTSRYYYCNESTYACEYKKYSDDPTCIAEDYESSEKAWATHGTNTSSTAAAPMNNGGGVGIAPEADILALKIDMSFIAIEGAIEYAISQKVDVINMSLGAYAESFTDGFGDSQTGYSEVATYLDSLCDDAYEAGIIVVAAAGNEATYHKSYPACNSHVIGVGAIGDYTNKGNASKLAEFTNYVSSSQSGEINVDILAPGYVYTATQGGSSSSSHSHTYSDTQGTSFSSPIVAGAACLWKQKYPNGTPDEFLSKLQSSADGIGEYAEQNVPVSQWSPSCSDVGPSNIANGRLNVANLLDITDPYVDVDQTSIDIVTNEKKQITLKSYNGDITYSSGDESIATVTSTGLVEGVSSGSTTIVVTATKNSKTATSSVSVNVSEPIATTSLAFNPNEVTLEVGKTYDSKSTLLIEPSNASKIYLFESENEAIATIDEDSGVITAISKGTATINVIAVYGDANATLTVSVNEVVTKSGLISFGKSDGKTNINSTSVTGKDSLGNSWNIVTSGTTSFTPNDSYSQIGSSKNPASKVTFSLTLSTSVEFSGISAKFGGFKSTAGSIDISVGTTSIGSGSLSGNNDVTVTSSKKASGTNLIITISSISKAIKAYSIAYTTSGSSSTVSSVNVTPSSLSLDFDGITTSTLTATVVGSGSPEQSVTWSTSDASIAEVDSNGVVTAIGGGVATIYATSTIDTSKKGSCTVTVVDSFKNITVTCEKVYHPGDYITSDDIEVNKVFSSGKTERVYDFSFASENYQFIYDDTLGGAEVSSKQFAVTYNSLDYSFTVNVCREAYIDIEVISKDLASDAFKNSNLSKSSSTASPTTVELDGISFDVTSNAYAYSKSGVYYLSFGKKAGSIQNTNPFTSSLTAVSITNLTSSRDDGLLQISKDNSSWCDYSESEIAKGGYVYFKYSFESTSSTYSNIQQISFATDGKDNPTNVSNYIMYEDVENQCLSKLDAALDKLNNMSADDKTLFNESNDYVIKCARERLCAWAKHVGKKITYEDNNYVVTNKTNNALPINQTSDITIIILGITLSMTSIMSVICIKKRKSY